LSVWGMERRGGVFDINKKQREIKVPLVKVLGG
jgi:hypothetical protein